MDEHRRSVSKKEERSQIYVHKRETQGHDFDIDNVKIIAKENNMKPRRFVEACFTKFTSNNINRSIDIPNCYNTILKLTFMGKKTWSSQMYGWLEVTMLKMVIIS